MPELVEMLWRVVGPSSKPIVCGIYRDSAGLEVCMYYGESVKALIRSERVADASVTIDRVLRPPLFLAGHGSGGRFGNPFITIGNEVVPY